MKGYILGMLAETPVHPGAGQVYSVIDLPVAREKTTGSPTIPGSGLKGALREKWLEEKGEKGLEDLFGKQDHAGAFGVADARLLLLPVRSLTGHYRWVTSPYLLKRFYRDMKMAGVLDKQDSFPLEIPEINNGEIIAAGVYEKDKPIFLEELTFKIREETELIERLVPYLKKLIRHPFLHKELKNRLSIINDEEFAYFARYGLPVNFRNVLETGTKKSNNLWQEEVIPPDTLFYTMFVARFGNEEKLKEFTDYLEDSHYLQVGGNETIGQGWMVTQVLGGGQNE